MLLVGIYSSAISMSKDSSVRRLIRTSILKESNIVDILGIPEMERKLAQKVSKMAKNHADGMSYNMGVRLLNDDDDINQYLDDVINEIKAKKAENNDSEETNLKNFNSKME
jgi:hypothetical protein